ncbi:MAG: RNA-binding protein [Planctomycetaceae bacterium]|nr:RNA-binding protein [Planctomycetaceae bacterium]
MNKPTKQTKTHAIDSPEEQDDAVIGQALKWSAAVILVLGLFGAVVAFLLSRPKPPEEVVETPFVAPQDRVRSQAQAPTTLFVDITGPAGITFKHENGAFGEKLLPETMGGGCAFFDYDNDHDQDILLVNSCRWPWDPRDPALPAKMALYRNDGRAHFTDVTTDVGLDASFYGMGVAVADYDSDGDVDIFISAVGPNRLFRNDGEKFVDVTAEAGVAGDGTAWGTSCAWFDYNNDGRLDLFVANYITWSKDIDLGQDFRLVGVGRAYGPPTAFEGSFPYLYRNDGSGKFSDVSKDAGMRVPNPATGVPMAKTMGVAPIDLDMDGWMDLVISNDTVQNFVFHNQQDGTFQEIGALVGVAFDSSGAARGAMGIDVSRFRNDSTLGIAIGNFANEMSALYAASADSMQFVDIAIASGLGPQTRLELTFGLFFFDYDLDGRLDLFCSNGHLEEEINKVQSSQQYRQPPQLFWNCGPDSSTEFIPVEPAQVGGDLLRRMAGRGTAFGDIDNDGDLDVLLMEVSGTPRLLRNDQQLGRHWVRLKLIGSNGNNDAIGAWIEVRSGETVLQRQVMPTRSYLSQSELPVTIGIGEQTRIDQVVIRWPDGSRAEVDDVKIDGLTIVRQQRE